MFQSNDLTSFDGDPVGTVDGDTDGILLGLFEGNDEGSAVPPPALTTGLRVGLAWVL